MTRRARLILLFTVAALALAGCAPAAEHDIHALADEMRPVVTAVAQLATTEELDDDLFLAETTDWCGSPSDPDDRGKERFYDVFSQSRMESWGANGYTIDTFPDAVHGLLEIPGWELEETVEPESIGGVIFVTTTFKLRPEAGGALIMVIVSGYPDSLQMSLVAETVCVPAA